MERTALKQTKELPPRTLNPAVDVTDLTGHRTTTTTTTLRRRRNQNPHRRNPPLLNSSFISPNKMNPTKSDQFRRRHHHVTTTTTTPFLFSSSPASSPDSETLTLIGNDAVSVSPHFIDPKPYISPQFYTFTAASHSLMLSSLLASCLPSSDLIRSSVSPDVLHSWRLVWRDRNEDTAYLTGWKRIQDKLIARVDDSGNRYICFKNSSNNGNNSEVSGGGNGNCLQQCVAHVDQWQEIVMSFHVEGEDSDSRHFGVRETIERVKRVWAVGAKFYGIPESYIRACVGACVACNAGGWDRAEAGRQKRRRFEYTESVEVPAKDVPNRLHQLAKKHKVVLCIRQKYIRYKPFMAEVKDYACHRAGKPTSKKSKVMKREPYASKRCGCGFRIRAIVPISNYNEKDKTFVYDDEGMAVFKMYAVHTGHQPGPLDGNARIMHWVVGHKDGCFMDQEEEYGVNEDMDSGALVSGEKGEFRLSVLQQLQELKTQLGLLEGKILNIPPELLGSLSQELHDIVNKVRTLGDVSKPNELVSDGVESDAMLVANGDLGHWSDSHAETLFGHGKDVDLIDDDEDSFGQTLGEVAPWDQMGADCDSQKGMMGEACKPEKWLNPCEFDEKSILVCEDAKLTKPIRHEDDPDSDVGFVDSFYPEHPKWYDCPPSLDSNTDCGDAGFRHR